MTAADAGVELDDLRVRFGEVVALDGVTLSIQPGEFFTLVGPSGCGKTTTLRTIAGFEEPTTGTVRIGGADVTATPPEDRNIGLVFQHYALFPHLDVRENIGYGLRFRDPPGGVTPQERIDELLDLVDLGGMGGRDPTQLSGGQRQRVALARALAPGPNVLLLDEPLSALDARLRERLRLTIRRVQRELGITTVYVTHDQAEALAVSDRVAVMRDGHVDQVGPPEAVYRDPSSRFVAEFVGDNNLLEATVTSADPPVASVGELAVPLSPETSVTVGRDVTLAIRPEHVRLGEGDVTLRATVTAVEFLGDSYRVHCDWGGQTLLAKVVRRPAVGDEIDLGFDPARLHILEDAVSGPSTGGYK